MGKLANERNVKAVITVYFSVVIGLILALLCTTIEAARTVAANTYISRVQQMAMESVLADYYLPLFDRYQLFGLHVTGESEEEIRQLLVNETSNGVNANLLFQRDTSLFGFLDITPKKSFMLCNPKLDQTKITQTRYLSDGQGQEMIRQASAYMKYSAPLSLLETLLDAKNMLTETEEAAHVTEKKLEVEETCTKIDERILRLVTLIDGIRTDEDGIWESGILKNLDSADSFVKQLVNFEVTQNNVQINHERLYELMEDEYQQYADSIYDTLQLGQTAYAEYVRLRQEEEAAQIPPEDSQLLYLEQDQSVSYTSDCLVRGVLTQAEAILDNITEAQALIYEIKELRTKVRQQADSFSQELEEIKYSLPEGLYEQLISTSPYVEIYADSDISGFGMIRDINQMEAALEQNQKILSEMLSLPVSSYTFESAGFSQWENMMSAFVSLLNSYTHSGLAFDYSQISFTKEKNTISGSIRNLIASGTASLVLEDTDKISKAVISGTDLVSDSIGMSSSNALSRLLSMLTTSREDTSELLKFGEEGETEESMIDWVDQILFLAYLADHTTNYCSDTYDPGQVLLYEQEYLLFGSQKDQENLNCCILRLIELRTIANFIYLLTDQEKTMQAHTFAASTVGITGLMFLVTAVKYIVLFAWAAVQAMVETAALLMGKEIEVLTTKSNFVVSFTELLSVSNSYIIAKAKNYNPKGFTLNYGNYLMMLLLFRSTTNNALRMMDLIQENLRYEYEDEFRIRNCLIGYEAYTVCTMRQKFLCLPLFSGVKTEINGYEFSKSSYVTY